MKGKTIRIFLADGAEWNGHCPSFGSPTDSDPILVVLTYASTLYKRKFPNDTTGI